MRLAMIILLPALTASASAPAQYRPDPPAASGARQYYIETLTERRVTSLPAGTLYWRVETFPTRRAARSAESAYSLSASVTGRHWLFTLGPRSGKGRGARVAEIGPVAVPRARTYMLRINHAGGPPGAQTPVHRHPGSEAIYVLRGQISQRTPHGVRRAEAGETLGAHAPDMSMQITSTGIADLEQLVMFVVDADRPFSPPASFE